MKKMSEDKIIVTQTFYGFDEEQGFKRFAVKGVKVEVKYDDNVIYERYMDECLCRKQSISSNPIDCFLDYILSFNEETESSRQYGNNISDGFNSIRHRWFKAFYFKKQFFKVLLNKFFLSSKPTVK